MRGGAPTLGRCGGGAAIRAVAGKGFYPKAAWPLASVIGDLVNENTHSRSDLSG